MRVDKGELFCYNGEQKEENMKYKNKYHKEQREIGYLECEKRWVYILLMMSAGYLGAFTFNLRGGVFCNAQTGNMVLMAIELGRANWMKALYYLIPLCAYIAGAVISEWLPERVNRLHMLRWDTILISFEIIAIFLLGLLPESAPFQISQITINFICSMQYNTFRQAQRVPMATTFCTNHVRQIGIHLVKWRTDKTDIASRNRILIHITMLAVFVAGGILSTAFGTYFYGKTVWGACVLLGIIWIALIHADLTTEKDMMDRKPAGH